MGGGTGQPFRQINVQNPVEPRIQQELINRERTSRDEGDILLRKLSKNLAGELTSAGTWADNDNVIGLQSNLSEAIWCKNDNKYVFDRFLKDNLFWP